MIKYSEFQPTGADVKGLGLEDRQDWLVAPVCRTRDSGIRANSNFEALLGMLGDGDDFETHSFTHWGPGWFEIILVQPGSNAARVAEECEKSLEDYPVLDDEDISKREWEEYCESWSSWGCRDFLKAVLAGTSLCEEAKDAFRDLSHETLRELYEKYANSSYEFSDEGCHIRTSQSAAKITEDMVIELIQKKGYNGDLYDPVIEQDIHGKWWVDTNGNEFNPNRISFIGWALFCDGVESPWIKGPFETELEAKLSSR